MAFARAALRDNEGATMGVASSWPPKLSRPASGDKLLCRPRYRVSGSGWGRLRGATDGTDGTLHTRLVDKPDQTQRREGRKGSPKKPSLRFSVRFAPLRFAPFVNQPDVQGWNKTSQGQSPVFLRPLPIRAIRVIRKAPSKLGGSCELQRVRHDKRSKVM